MQKCEAHLSLRSPCTSSVGSVCVSVTPSEKTVGDGTADIQKKQERQPVYWPARSFPLLPEVFLPSFPPNPHPIWA